MNTAPTPAPNPAVEQITVDGIDVLIEGQGTSTVVMIHGWPDTHRLWDSTVSHLAPQWRCVRFTLAGFDIHRPPRPLSLDDTVALIGRVVDAVSPSQPVTLLLHDWGCVFGYQYVARNPQRVRAVVGVDIGDHTSGAFLRSLTGKARWQIFAYQIWLAAAWCVGRYLSSALGNAMSRSMARSMRCRTDPQRIGWQQNYPYLIQWTGAMGSYRQVRPWKPHCPTLYLYGRRKPFMFHSPQWLEQVRALPGGAVAEMPTGHWVMVDQAQDFHWRVGQWLGEHALAAQPAMESTTAAAPGDGVVRHAAHEGIGALLEMAREAAHALPFEPSCERFYFLRHGQTARNASRTFQPPDEPLDDTGRAQAAAAAQRLAAEPLGSVVASSMPRALETARIVWEAQQGQAMQPAPPQHSDALRERFFGEWIGSSSVHIDWAATPPGGESLQAFVQRTALGLRDALASAQPTLVVAHGGTLYVLCGLLGIQPTPQLLGNALPLLLERTAQGWVATPLAEPAGLSFNLS